MQSKIILIYSFSGESHDLKQPGPLLLTWIDFNSSIDK